MAPQRATSVPDRLVLREATIADLRPLAELHVRTFNETHVGPFGSGPTLATREMQWREKLLEADATKRMVAAAVGRLLEHRLTSMVLFTEADNEPACRFYDKLGGERQLDERGKFGGMYGWRDLRKLESHLAGQTS